MKALEEAAREIGVAVAECGADPDSLFVGELAGTLAELASEPTRRRRWQFFRKRRGRRPAPAAERARRPD